MRRRLKFTYTWNWLSSPSAAVPVSLYLDVLYGLASVLSGRWTLDLDFCIEGHIGMVDYAAARYTLHVALRPVAKSPSLRTPAAVPGSHSHNTVLSHLTSRPDGVALDIGLGMVEPAHAECTDYRPWCRVNRRQEYWICSRQLWQIVHRKIGGNGQTAKDRPLRQELIVEDTEFQGPRSSRQE